MKLVNDEDGTSTAWATLDRMPQLIAQMSAGKYRVLYTLVKAA